MHSAVKVSMQIFKQKTRLKCFESEKRYYDPLYKKGRKNQRLPVGELTTTLCSKTNAAKPDISFLAPSRRVPRVKFGGCDWGIVYLEFLLVRFLLRNNGGCKYTIVMLERLLITSPMVMDLTAACDMV